MTILGLITISHWSVTHKILSNYHNAEFKVKIIDMWCISSLLILKYFIRFRIHENVILYLRGHEQP